MKVSKEMSHPSIDYAKGTVPKVHTCGGTFFKGAMGEIAINRDTAISYVLHVCTGCDLGYMEQTGKYSRS